MKNEDGSHQDSNAFCPDVVTYWILGVLQRPRSIGWNPVGQFAKWMLAPRIIAATGIVATWPVVMQTWLLLDTSRLENMKTFTTSIAFIWLHIFLEGSSYLYKMTPSTIPMIEHKAASQPHLKKTLTPKRISYIHIILYPFVDQSNTRNATISWQHSTVREQKLLHRQCCASGMQWNPGLLTGKQKGLTRWVGGEDSQ